MKLILEDGGLSLVPTADAPGDVIEIGRHVQASSSSAGGRRTPSALDREIAEMLDLRNLGKTMREGVVEPEMLVERWLQRGVLHWLQGEPEDGKSWIAVELARRTVEPDGRARVLWLDAEMGERAMSERLMAVGLDPRTVERQFVYANLGVVSRAGFAKFREWVGKRAFTLVVWDPMAQHFAAADVNDDRSNSEVATWIVELVNPVSAYGGTTICVDHLAKGKDSKGYARGAGSKKARARVVYEVRKRRPFDRSSVGELLVATEKNSDAATIPTRRAIRIGGTPFLFEEHVEDERSARLEQDAWFQRDVQSIRAALRVQQEADPDQPELSLSKLSQLANGDTNRLRKVLKRLANEPAPQERLALAPMVVPRVHAWETKNGERKETLYFRLDPDVRWTDAAEVAPAKTAHGGAAEVQRL